MIEVRYADVQRIRCLLKDESGENVVISKVPVRVRLESFVGLIDPSAVCETNYEGGIELYVVSNVHAVKERGMETMKSDIPLLASSASQQ